MVVLTRSKAKYLRETLSEEQYSNMFQALNLRFRRGSGRRAASRAVETAAAIFQRVSDDSDSDYDPAIGEIGPRVNQEANRPAVIADPPPIEAPLLPSNASPRRFSMKKIVLCLQLIFYSVAILLLAYVIFNRFFEDEDMEILVRRRRF